MTKAIALLFFISANLVLNAQIKIAPAFGYDSCLIIRAKDYKLVIDPNVGGRVMEYSIKGKNIIYEDHDQDGWTPEQSEQPPNGHIAGARFDVGPLQLRNNDREFWYGKWSYEIKGDYSVTIKSKIDKANDIQLERDFTLDEKTGELSFEQRIYNRDDQAQRFAYWSRTFYTGGGTVILPLNPESKYPGQFAVYGDRKELMVYYNYDINKEPTLTKQNGYLFINGPFSYQKIDLDMSYGWVGYLQDDLFFSKTFPVYEDKVYADVTGANFSVWYNENRMVEIEPIGPWEWIEPDSAISFTENWQLKQYPALKKGESKRFDPLDFHTRTVAGFAPAYYHKGKKAMAINSVKYPDQWSAAEMIFPMETGIYNLNFTSLLETDGESSYKVFVDEEKVGEFQNIATDQDYLPYSQNWKKIELNKGSIIRVEFISHSNGKVPEGNGFAYSRGRWTGLTFTKN